MNTRKILNTSLFLFASFVLPLQIVHSSEMKFEAGPMGSGRFLTPCNIDGRHFDCFVDTGSDFSLVNDDEVFRKYPSSGELRYAGAGGVFKETDKIRINKFVVDGKTIRNVELGRFSPEEHWSTRLGMNILKNYRVQMNFKKKKIRIGVRESCGKDLVSFTLRDKGIPAMPIEIGGEKVTAMFDTGAALTVVDANLISKKPDLFAFLGDVNGGDSTNHKVDMKAYQAKELVIGNTSFKDLLVLSMDFTQMKKYFGNDVHAIIGFNLFVQRNWYFDFPEGHFRLY